MKNTISNETDGSPNKRPYIGQIGENLEGDVIDVILVKGERGFGFTIVGGDEPGEMIQINAIVATGNPRPSGKVNFHIFFLKSLDSNQNNELFNVRMVW